MVDKTIAQADTEFRKHHDYHEEDIPDDKGDTNSRNLMSLDTAKNAANTLAESAQDTWQKISESNFVESVKGAASDAYQSVSDAAQNLYEQASDYINSGSDDKKKLDE